MMISPEAYRTSLQSMELNQLLIEEIRLEDLIKSCRNRSVVINDRPSTYDVHAKIEEEYLHELSDEIITRYMKEGTIRIVQNHYSIIMSGNEIWAGADERIPFEITNPMNERKLWMRQFRLHFKAILRRFKVNDSDIFRAQYKNNIKNDKESGYDLENILLYNLSMVTFSEHMRNGVLLSELDEDGSIPKELTFYNHIYHYSEIPLYEANRFYDEQHSILEWSNAMIDKGASSAMKYWKAIRQSNYIKKADCVGMSNYSIRITVHNICSIYFHNLIKPLIDGTVCAFCNISKDMIPEHISSKEGIDLLLRDDSFPILFTDKNVVRGKKSGQSIIWNPPDDRCKMILITKDTDSHGFRYDGELYVH